MWGASERIEAPAVPPLTPNFQSVNNQQLARINYKRPETWSFFFGGELISGDASLGGDQLIELKFNLFLGVGRSVFSTRQKTAQTPLEAGAQAFCHMLWNIPPGQVVEDADVKWTTEVPTPILNDNLGDFTNTCDWFPAQDVQCQVQLVHTKSDPDQTVLVAAHAYFAPRTHLRPDWYQRASEAARFRGSEPGGT